MSLGERVDYSVGLLLVSLVLATVPLYDMWQDVFVGGKSPLSTLLENSVFVFLVAFLVGLSLWLLTNDWEEEYVQRVARWSVAGTAVVALVFGWVLGFQILFQNDLKPFVIAADGVVIGGIVLFVAGVYNARSRRESAARAVERDRFSALFDNTSDAVAAVAFEGDTVLVTDVNTPFERAFDCRRAEVSGSPIDAVLPVPAGVASEDEGGDSHGKGAVERVAGDPDAQAELRRETGEGVRDFLVDYVPIAGGDDGDADPTGFLVFTDITPQKERERQLETLSEGTEGLLEARSVDGIVGAVRSLAGELFGNAVVGVWEYDADADVFRPVLGVAAGDRIDDPPTLPAEDRAGTDGGVPTLDVSTLSEALSDRGVGVEDLLFRPLSDSHRLVIGRRDAALTTTDRYTADLLATNTRSAIERVDRETELARRNDQLEFVNSLLRHDIQNSMTVVRSRGQALAESLSGTEREYAETIVEQSDEVVDIVDRFRALLNALTGTADATLEPTSLSATLRDRIGTFRTTHPEADVVAEVPDGLEVLADDMLPNVVANVLENAVEHNDGETPRVEVTATERDHRVAVRVADDGPGIPDDQKEAVFRRGDRGLKGSDVGSGFGLFFVDAMMDRYGGEVVVEDADLGGAAVVLRFPTP